MERRTFLRSSGALAAGAMAVSGCAQTDCAPGEAASEPVREWKMVTSWPQNFPGLGSGAADLAAAITAMSGGRLNVKVYGAGDLVPAFEVFDAVSAGTAEMGHSGAYYWKGKSQALQFFSAIPFGLNGQAMNGWLYEGGGLDLWTEIYDDFNLVPFPAGNSGVQMGGWFNKPIDTVDDLQGLKMRIPGLGGEVLRRAGGTPVTLPGAEIFTALEAGTIDATEWVGPYNDRAFGLYQAARYYYYPGWHEPGTTLECMVNKQAYNELPADLQAIVRHACRSINDSMAAEFTAQNAYALTEIRKDPSVELRPFPEPVLQYLRQLSLDVVEEIAAADPQFKRVLDSYLAFGEQVRGWNEISEQAYAGAGR
ncbi:MAG: TRAP transporter substrate-binding protein [Pseudomonadota bacterium]